MPRIAWPRRNPPNERETLRLEEPGLGLPRPADEREEERRDLVAVDDHVQGQDQDQEQRPHRPEARDGELLDRARRAGPRSRRRVRGCRRPGPPGRPGGPNRVERLLPRRPGVCGSVSRSCGTLSTNSRIDGRERAGERGRRRGRSARPAPRRRGSSRRPAAGTGSRPSAAVTIGLRMNARSQARKKMRIVSPNAKKADATM